MGVVARCIVGMGFRHRGFSFVVVGLRVLLFHLEPDIGVFRVVASSLCARHVAVGSLPSGRFLSLLLVEAGWRVGVGVVGMEGFSGGQSW
jgi:hypothetical protein